MPPSVQYKAKKLPRDPGPAAWNKILPPRPIGAALETDIKCDWLVIGAGFAGLSAARRLSQFQGEGDSIVVIDATTIGDSPAGRNSGFMIDLPHDLSSEDYTSSLERDLWQIKLNRQAISFAREAAEEYQMPSEAVDACGRINGAADKKGLKHNKDYAAHLKNLGEAFEEFDAQAMTEITGSEFYWAGLYLPGACILQPALYIRSLADGLKRKVSLYENTPALIIKQQGQGWHVQTPKGSISSSKIILAVNGHAESFGFFKRRLMHIFTYASMTEAMTKQQIKTLGGERKWGITPSDPMGSSVRRISGIGGDRIIVRNRWSFDPSMEVSEGRIARYGRDQDKGFLKRFPMLEGLKMDYRWSGRLCLSYNSAPAFGEVADGMIAACCQNGLGTAKGTLSGIAAAELALGVDSPLADALLAAPLPQKLPPKPIAWLGANAMIAWREFKARAEI